MHIFIDKIYISIVNCFFVFFCKFTKELRPLIDIRIWFLLHILRSNRQHLTKFRIHIIIDKIYVEIIKRLFFGKFATELRSVTDVRKCFLFNILRTNGQNITNFIFSLSLTRFMFELLCTISFSDRVMSLYIFVQ